MKPTPPGGKSHPPDPIASALVDAMEPMVHDLFDRVLGERLAHLVPPEQPPALLTSAQICQQLGISRSKLAGLRARGLPSLRCGDSPRFVLDDVIAWLRDAA